MGIAATGGRLCAAGPRDPRPDRETLSSSACEGLQWLLAHSLRRA